MIDKWKLTKFVGTKFDKNDLVNSTLCVYLGTWELGYPQPEKDFGYMSVTYDTSDYCVDCGVGAVQKSPFRIKKQPQWGKKSMFDLNWVIDEIFVNRKIYKDVFEKFGIEKLPVLLLKDNEELDDTFQLKIPQIDIALDLKAHPYEVCKTCGRMKYDPQIKGYFPGFKGSTGAFSMFKSREYFGSGHQAFHRIFISKELISAISKFGPRPSLAPVG